MPTPHPIEANAPGRSGAGRGAAAKVVDIYQLSPVQQGMAYHSLCAPESGVYVQQLTWRTEGPVDRAAWRAAWRWLVERHAILRTAIVWSDLETPVQVVHREAELPLEEEDWRGSTRPVEAHLRDLLAADRRRGFDLRRPPLMRIKLIRTGEHEHRCVCTFHHVLLDGWSLTRLLGELVVAYRAGSAGETPSLPAPPPFRGYIAWLRRRDPRAALAYWRAALAGVAGPTPLPRGEPDAEDAERPTMDATLSPAASEAVRSAARRLRVTQNVLFLGAWALVLGEYGGEEEVVLGVTVSGRPPELPDVDSLVGNLINTLPLRVPLPHDRPVGEWLRAIQVLQAEILQYQDSPLATIQRQTEVPNGIPLFESIVVFENHPVPEGDLGLDIRDVQYLEQTNYPLTLTVYPGDAIGIRIDYDSQRFGRRDVGQLLAQLERAVSALVEQPEVPLARISLLEEDDRRRPPPTGPGEPLVVPADVRVDDHIVGQAERTPSRTAVVAGLERLTYGELEARSAALAAALARLGVGPDVAVGVLLPRSTAAITAVLGILRAGGAFVPIDPAHGEEHARSVLRDVAAPIVVTEGRWAGVAAACGARTLVWDGRVPRRGAAPEEGHRRTPEALAYAVYTSGSTGRPKGVLIPHRALLNAYLGWARVFELSDADVHLQMAGFGFDVFVGDFVRSLCSGATLVLCDRDTLVQCDRLYALMRREGVTVAEFVPTVLRTLADHLEDVGGSLESLRILAVGSEAWSVADGRRLRALCGPGPRLFNTYGLAEATIDSSYFEWTGDGVPGDGGMPIFGRPFPNTRLTVLSRRGHPAPVGAVGELVVGGPGVARGYLNQPGLTAERFLDEPAAGAGARMCRTGDLVRCWPGGVGELVGRLDGQRKVRGIRIEPGEIEAAVTRHPEVKACAVDVQDRDGRSALVCYYVRDDDAPLRPEGLRAFLRSQLPRHLWPNRFVPIDALPLGPNGKVDRRRLSTIAPGSSADETVDARPLDPLELALSGAWSEVLGVDAVDLDADFFELGGHSLLAPRLAARVSRVAGVELTLSEVLERPTVRALAAHVRARRVDGAGETSTGPAPPDLARDAELPSHIDARRLPGGFVASPGGIFLTGATGFVGAFLLDELLRRTGATITCLVRAPHADDARRRLRRHLASHGLANGASHRRVEAIAGDLSQPGLGLGRSDFRRLAAQTDEIYHCGASVELLRPYASLRAANVGGTLEILRLASTVRRKPVHLVSTLSIFSASGYARDEVLDEACDPIHSSGLPDGYTASKWVAERLAIAARARGIPVSVYRLGSVTGHSTTGQFRRLETDFLWTMIKAFLYVGIAPALDATIDMVPVDYAVAAIAALARDERRANSTYHVCNDRSLGVEALCTHLRTLGYRLDGCAREAGLRELAAALERDPTLRPFAAVLAAASAAGPLLPEERGGRVTSRATQEAVRPLGLACPPADLALLGTYVERLVATGELPVPCGGSRVSA